MGRSGTGVFAVTCTRSSFVQQQYAFACRPLFSWPPGLAVKFGDRRDMALFDLLVGSINVCNTPEHGNPRFHAIMARGYTALEALKEPDLFEQAAPYLGIYHFIEGNYEQAMNLFSRASRKPARAGAPSRRNVLCQALELCGFLPGEF